MITCGGPECSNSLSTGFNVSVLCSHDLKSGFKEWEFVWSEKVVDDSKLLVNYFVSFLGYTIPTIVGGLVTYF